MWKRVEKTRNAWNRTEAKFRWAIRSSLRKVSMYWKPIALSKQNVRRESKNINKRIKYEYQCSTCKKWFTDKQIEVDHVIPAGSLKSAKDLEWFVERLFCEVDWLQVLCKECHNKKTFIK